MKKFKRIFVIVMDSLGVGAEPDAAEYGDAGTDTWGHIGENYQLTMPTLQKMGIANLHHIKGVEPVENPIGYVGKLQEASKGKDTLTGHWEIMGLKVTDPFIAFTDTGFPQELLDRLEKETGHGWLGNYSASGTEIIKELGEEHLRTGKMIVYTSADSVLQIACHEEAFGLQELYRCCEIAREICMKPEWKVGRIIARPFVGDNASNFTRDSAARHDLAVAPFAPTVMNTMQDAGLDVIGVGKIFDIFSGQGVTETHKGGSNKEHMEMTIELAKKDFTGLCFVNLVDFDALFGHRRDPIGYGKAIDEFDKQLAELLEVVRDDDLIICTADHGNDPTWVGTDHTREMIPVIAYSKSFTSAGQLDLGYTFANIGATVADNFEVKMPENGESFLDKLV